MPGTRDLSMNALCWLLASCLLFLSSSADSAPDLASLKTRALSLELDREEGWLALGHYRASRVGDGWESDADDPAFFLAANGKANPRAELLATLEALVRPGHDDHHPQCRFPARSRWLQEHLRFRLPDRRCNALREWREMLQAHAVTLVFPTAYLNSPSSMFGHTFLRLDRPNQTDDNALLAYTINYAAEAVDENELFYAYRGLFGGYPGSIGFRPYYDKVKEYRDWENRDIWEYRLNLTPLEVEQLVDHTWEIKPIRFDYFFIGENCSYRLLSLLDVARPGLKLRSRFPLRAIPADTVRAIVAAGLVLDTRYRPSAATTLDNHRRQLNATERRVARKLGDGEILPDEGMLKTMAPSRQAAILETAYEFTRYRAVDEKLPRESTAKSSLALLRARSRIDGSAALQPPARPDVRDDEGHGPMAAGIGFGYYDHRAYGELRLRSAYHDLTDPWPGYRAGAQIRFLDGALRYTEDSRLQLERLDALSISSISPRSDFIKPISWSFNLGAYRRLLRDSRPLLGAISADVGAAYEVAGGLAFAMTGARIEAGAGLDEGLQLGLGPRVGWLYRGLGGQGILGFDIDCYLIGPAYCGGKLSLRHSVNLDRNLALAFSLSREQGQGRLANEFGLSLLRYF